MRGPDPGVHRLLEHLRPTGHTENKARLTLFLAGPPGVPRHGDTHAVQPVQGPQDDRCEQAADRLELPEGRRGVRLADSVPFRYVMYYIANLVMICNDNLWYAESWPLNGDMSCIMLLTSS